MNKEEKQRRYIIFVFALTVALGLLFVINLVSASTQLNPSSLTATTGYNGACYDVSDLTNVGDYDVNTFITNNTRCTGYSSNPVAHIYFEPIFSLPRNATNMILYDRFSGQNGSAVVGYANDCWEQALSWRTAGGGYNVISHTNYIANCNPVTIYNQSNNVPAKAKTYVTSLDQIKLFDQYATSANGSLKNRDIYLTYDLDDTPPSLIANLTDGQVFRINYTGSLTIPTKVNNSEDGTIYECDYLINNNPTENSYACTKNVWSSVNVAGLNKGNNNITFKVYNGAYQQVNQTYYNIFVQPLQFLENSQTFNATTTGTTTESYIINVTYDSSYYTSASAVLTYKGVNYSSIKVGTGDTVNFVASITLPNTPATNYFNWTIALYNGTGYEYYRSTTNTQTIGTAPNIAVSTTSCSAGFIPVMNFTFADENNLTLQNAQTLAYNFQYGVSNTSAILTSGTLSNIAYLLLCANSSIPSYTIGYGELQYTVANDVARRYYVFSGTRLTTSLINITAYDLPTTQATAFSFNAHTSGLIPYTNYYMALLRWYPDLNSYKVVDMTKTDNTGSGLMYVKVQDVDYRVALYDVNGNLIQLDSPTRFVCQTNPCTYTMTVNSNGGGYFSIAGLQQNLSFNSNTSVITYIWNDPTQASNTYVLDVEQQSGTGNLSICRVTSTAYTGVMTCDTSGYTGLIQTQVTQTDNSIPINTLLSNAGNGFATINSSMSLFIVFIVAGFMFLVGIANPFLAIILGLASLIPLAFLGIVNSYIIIGIVIIGGAIIHFIRKG